MKEVMKKILLYVVGSIILSIFICVVFFQVEEWDAVNKKRAVSLSQGQSQEDIVVGRQALTLSERQNYMVIEDILNLSQIYAIQGNFDKTIPLLQQGLEFVNKEYGPESSPAAYALNVLAMSYIKLGKYEKAEILAKQALSIANKIPDEGPAIAADIHKQLGITYLSSEKYEKAEDLLKKSLSIKEKELGTDHFELAVILEGLGIASYKKQQHQEALQFFQRALDIKRKYLGADHLKIATALNWLGRVYQDRALSANHFPRRGKEPKSLNYLEQRKTDRKKAESYYQEAIMIAQKHFKENASELKIYRRDLASLLVEQEKFDR